MNLLITGKPGVGKTTLIQKIIANTHVAWGGFYTQEIRENDNRVGFQIIALNGQTGILAHIKYQSKFRVGKYYVNIQDLDSIAVRAVQQAIIERKPILIDEIGKMELYSEKFKMIVNQALNAVPPVLGTITMANLSFVNMVKQRQDVTIAELTSNNRTFMETLVTDFLAKQGIF